MCCDVEGGWLSIRVAKEKKPIDYRHKQSRKEDKERRKLRNNVRTEKRRAAEAKRKLGDRKRGGNADARNTGSGCGDWKLSNSRKLIFGNMREETIDYSRHTGQNLDESLRPHISLA
jgi:hypothetical protein